MTQPVLSVLGGFVQANLLTDDGNVIPVLAVPSPVAQQTQPAPALLQGALFFDPQNVSGNAGAGAGFGQSAAAPLKSWSALAQAWGTFSPYLTTPTAITQLSSHTDNTDPIIFSPYIAKGVPVVLQGATPAVIATGNVLSGVTGKNRALGSNSALRATFPGTPALGQMVINRTGGKASRSWVQRSIGAGVFQLMQPLAPQAATGGAFSPPAEVDTWANGDTVDLVQPIASNIAYLDPIGIDGFAGRLLCYQLQVFSPNGLSASYCSVSASGTMQVQFLECSFQRACELQASSSPVNAVFSNCCFQGNLLLQAPFFMVGGGSCSTTGAYLVAVPSSSDTIFDADHIIGGNATMSATQRILIGFLCLDGGGLTVRGAAPLQFATSTGLGYGGTALYASAPAGPSQLNLAGRTRAIISGTTFVAALTAPNVATGVLFNGQANGVTHTNGNPDVLTGNVATTPTNLDANNVANGGIGTLGGASIGFGA